MALSDEQWQAIADKTGCIFTGDMKDAVEAEVRAQDTTLIRQLVEALNECKDSTQERIDHMVGSGLDKHKPVAFDAYVQDLLRANQALAAGRARLEGKQ